MSSLKDTNTNGQTMQFVAVEWPRPSDSRHYILQRHSATSLAVRRVLDSRKILPASRATKYYTGHRGLPRSTAFLSFPTVWFIARGYTLGRIPRADLGTHDFRIDLHPSFSSFDFLTRDRSKHRGIISQGKQIKIHQYTFSRVNQRERETILACIN